MDDEGLSPIHRHNQQAWNQMVQRQDRFTRPAADREVHDPLSTAVGQGWLEGELRGKDVLCLAAGGGRQGVIYAAAGANVTVVDLSPAMLELDRQAAAQRQLHLRTIEASMDRLQGVPDASFDLIIHPVSTCYVPDIAPVYLEAARVIRDHGLYISQHKQPVSLQASVQPSPQGYVIVEPYYRHRRAPLPPVHGTRLREQGALEFLHRWEQLIGLMCRAGFVIEDLIEPAHMQPQAEPGAFAHRAQFIAPYVRIKARRRPRPGIAFSR